MKVFEDRFGDFPIGEVRFDYSALGEYHWLGFPANPGGWVEVTNHTSWGRLGNWQIVDDGGRRVLQQARLRREGLPMLAAGDANWQDLDLTAEVRLLAPTAEAGVMVRYRNNRTHYSVRIGGEGRVRLVHRHHEEKVTLAEASWQPDFGRYHRLSLKVRGPAISARLDERPLFEVSDGGLTSGRIGLLATGPARFAGVEVAVEAAEKARLSSAAEDKAAELQSARSAYPQPVLWRSIETAGFGTGRQVRFGDLNGDGRLELVLAQYTEMLNGGDFPLLSCLTAIDLDGRVLWQWGEPDPRRGLIPADLPFQVHDLDGDGRAEVICCRDFEICILDGATGELRGSAPTPEPGPMATWLPEDNLFRIPGDSICFADLRGAGRPTDLLVKDRYSNLTAYDDQLGRLWRFHGNTGHFPAVADLDGDGRDEVMIGYTLVDHDGTVLWRLDLRDHQDAIAIAPLDPREDEPQLALACGEAGVVVCDLRGEILWRDLTGHVQRLTAARVRADAPGLQVVTKTFWGSPDILSLYDCAGVLLESVETAGSGAVLSPVNWRGDGLDLLLTSGSLRLGGLLDGHLRPVVSFPDDGHPTLCAEALDLTGDCRDEIVLWDVERMWIYTQDSAPACPDLQAPRRQPHYSMSNYRAEVSVPIAVKREAQ